MLFLMNGGMVDDPTVIDNGEAVDLKPGDMHLCANGSKHSIENRTDRDAVVIALILNDLAEG